MGKGLVVKVFAKKIGMTQVYDKSGKHEAVTVLGLLSTKPCKFKTKEGDGYNSVIYGLYENSKPARKSIANQFGRFGEELVKVVEERVNDGDASKIEIGKEINTDNFDEGMKVSVVAISKGKGFAGTVKRHGFNTGPKTHGSHNYRQPGSIGDTGPQRVVKGKKMAGHMGFERNTIKNVSVIRLEKEKNRIYVSGPIPGANKSIVIIVKND